MEPSISKKAFSSKDLTYMAMGAVLLVLCAWISIPLPAVPITLQTFGVFFVLAFLGGLRGSVSIVLYILLGIIGLPVFSGFTGGLGVLLNTTGGYIVGFILTGLVYLIFEKALSKAVPAEKSYFWQIPALFIGLILCYLAGTLWFSDVYARQSGPIGFGTILSWCVIPFIIPDIMKMGLAYALAKFLQKVTERGRK